MIIGKAPNFLLRLVFSVKIAALHSSISLARACLKRSKSSSYMVFRASDVSRDKGFGFDIDLKHDELTGYLGAALNLHLFIKYVAFDIRA